MVFGTVALNLILFNTDTWRHS